VPVVAGPRPSAPSQSATGSTAGSPIDALGGPSTDTTADGDIVADAKLCNSGSGGQATSGGGLARASVANAAEPQHPAAAATAVAAATDVVDAAQRRTTRASAAFVTLPVPCASAATAGRKRARHESNVGVLHPGQPTSAGKVRPRAPRPPSRPRLASGGRAGFARTHCPSPSDGSRSPVVGGRPGAASTGDDDAAQAQRAADGAAPLRPAGIGRCPSTSDRSMPSAPGTSGDAVVDAGSLPMESAAQEPPAAASGTDPVERTNPSPSISSGEEADVESGDSGECEGFARCAHKKRIAVATNGDRIPPAAHEFDGDMSVARKIITLWNAGPSHLLSESPEPSQGVESLQPLRADIRPQIEAAGRSTTL
jgi:hypothetical protein